MDGLKQLLAGARRVAMQYSPNCAIPYVSMVDAGTVELVRGAGRGGGELGGTDPGVRSAMDAGGARIASGSGPAGGPGARARRFDMIGERTRNGGSVRMSSRSSNSCSMASRGRGCSPTTGRSWA